MVYFQTKKNPILGKFLEGIGMENVGMCNLWPFENFYDHLV
jgi:hypothetical protein